MNDDLKALLSAYLDGQVTPGQSRQVEDLLARDPAFRAEWEDLKSLAESLEAAAAPPAAVPADFREKIMARLKTGSGGGNAGLGAAGLVLMGLLGAFIYLDHRSDQAASTPHARPSPESLEAPGRAAGGVQPEYRGRIERADPEDIRSLTSGQLPDAQRRGPARLDGEAYLTGAVSVRSRSAGREVASGPEVSSGAGLDLERFDAWDRDAIAQRLGGSTASADTLAQLAQTYRLHPGLLLAARQDLPQLSTEDAARRLRTSLDASAAQPEGERLRQAVTALGGDPAWSPRWKKSLDF